MPLTAMLLGYNAFVLHFKVSDFLASYIGVVVYVANVL
jgi:hypothetical protein